MAKSWTELCPACKGYEDQPHAFDESCFAPYGAIKNEVHRLRKELNIALLKLKEGERGTSRGIPVRIIPADATSQEN